MIDRASVQAWLDKYIEAWRTYDRQQIADLFAENAVYHHDPFDEGDQGREAIIAEWLDNPDKPGSWKAEYHPIAVDGDTAVVQGQTHYFNDDGSIRQMFGNLFVIRFDDAGKCVEFTEWYMTPQRG